MVTAEQAKAISEGDNRLARLERAFTYIKAAAIEGKRSVHLLNTKTVREDLETLGYTIDPYSAAHMEVKW